MKCLVVEDEPLSADHLIGLIRRFDPTIEIFGPLDTLKSVVQFFEEGNPIDLLLLDIHLADGNSFRIFDSVRIQVPVIFTTAYDQYAVKAFKQNSIDYVLKPVSFPDLSFALEKFLQMKQNEKAQVMEMVYRLQVSELKTYKRRMMVKSGNTVSSIPCEEIHHFEARNGLSFLVTSSGIRHLIDYSLEQLETMLDPLEFFRMNRKVILRISSVGKCHQFMNGRFSVTAPHLDEESRIVSRERVTDFKKWLNG